MAWHRLVQSFLNLFFFVPIYIHICIYIPFSIYVYISFSKRFSSLFTIIFGESQSLGKEEKLVKAALRIRASKMKEAASCENSSRAGEKGAQREVISLDMEG